MERGRDDMDLMFCRFAAIAFTLLFLIGVYTVIMLVIYSRGIVNAVFTLLLTVASYFGAMAYTNYLVVYTGQFDQRGRIYEAVELMPKSVAAIGIIFLFMLFVLLILDFHNYVFSRITPLSVKKGIDALPDGLLFYYDDGSIQMVNPAMNRIAEAICGRVLFDGKELMERLCEGTSFDGKCSFIRNGKEAIVKLPDGKVYGFETKRKIYRGSEINELIAFDVTRENELSESLDEMNRELKKQNERLQALNDSITDMTIDSEILKTKIKIHDELGNCIGTARHYLEGESGDRSEVLTKFRNTLEVMDLRESADVRSGYATVLKAARDVGVNVDIEGELPKGVMAERITCAAIRECTANTFMHAHGDELKIKCESDGYNIWIVISNNGDQPKEEIKERGGLKNLRKLVETCSGFMSVESTPRFLLTINLDNRVLEIMPEAYLAQ